MSRRKPTAVQKMFMLDRGAKAHGMTVEAYIDMLHEVRRAMEQKAQQVKGKVKP